MKKALKQINIQNVLKSTIIITLLVIIFALIAQKNRYEENKNKYYTQELGHAKEKLDTQIEELEGLIQYPEKIIKIMVDEPNQCDVGMLSLYREFDNLTNVMTILEENREIGGIAAAVYDVASGLVEFKEFCDFEEAEDALLTRADLLVYLERVHEKFVEWQEILETDDEPVVIMLRLSEAANYNSYNNLYYINDLLSNE